MLSFLQGEDARIAVVVAVSAMILCFVLRMTWRALSRQMARASVNNVPRPALFLPAIVFLAFFIHGGTKTNGLFSMMFARRSIGTVVTEAEIAAGHRLESVVTNESYSYECPSNGVRDTAWHRSGGHSAFRRHDFAEEFPFGTNSIGHLTVFQGGSLYLRPRDESPLLKPHDGIFCFVPGVSDFWSYSDPAQRVFTWDRVLDYDRTNEVHSMQITHYPTGNFIVRLDDIEKNYRWINPDDWDGDGLANEIDAAPQVCDGDFYGVAAALPEGANPDAYYWIDMCVTGSLGVATVRISCGEPTNLGDHVIIARTNEVFRVPLLKGTWYQIDSTLPASVVETSSSDVVVEPDGCNPKYYISVYYHVDFWFENIGSHCNLSCSDNLGAVMSDLSGGCCLADIGATSFRWCCNTNCNCGGSEHDMSAFVTWEGYTSWFSSPVYCTCIPQDLMETQYGGKVGVSFSSDVVIFENSYTNAPNDIVPLKSTVNTLSISAFGGQFGGVLDIDLDDGDNKLAWHDGDILMSPIEIPAGGREELRIEYTAYTNSETINDIVARVRFTEYFSNEVIEDSARTTAVRVEVEPLVTIGNFFNRHIAGLGENVICRVYPRQAQWCVNFASNTFLSDEYHEVRFYCPFYEIDGFMKFEISSVNFSSAFKVMAPKGVSVKNARELLYPDAIVNKAGWAGMVLDLVVIPTNVCFSALHIMEVPEDKGKILPTGYFSGEEFSAIWHHTCEMGAGVWHRVQRDNHFLNDEARCGEMLPDNWSNGQITWRIPIAWGRMENGSDECIQNEFGEPYYQIFRMSSNGTLRVIKFEDYWVERTPQGIRSRSDKVNEGFL